MNTTQTFQEAGALGYLISSRADDPGIFPEWVQACRTAQRPCSTVRLVASREAGTVVITFPRRRQPSPDCQREMLAAAQWAVNANERPTNLDVCRHELMAGYVREEAIDGLIRETVKLWQDDQAKHAW